MSSNPYAPPTAEVDASIPDRATLPPFFAVSTLKLAVMSLCTLGLYEVYWFYMNWRAVKRRDRSDIWPVPRAIFGFFFCFAMFDRMRRDGAAHAVGGAPAMGPLTALWIIVSLCWKLPDPYWLVSMLAFVALLPVQDFVNRVNAQAAPGHDANRRFSALNWVGIVLGGAFLVLAIIGTLAGPVPDAPMPAH